MMTCTSWLMLAASLASVAAPAPAAEKLFRALGFTTQEAEGLRRGEIVSHAVKELIDKELEINRDILAHGVLDPGVAGSRFNLSHEELRRFGDLRLQFPAKGCEKDRVCTDAVVSTLRQVLR